jgi:hypothetical protein
MSRKREHLKTSAIAALGGDVVGVVQRRRIASLKGAAAPRQLSVADSSRLKPRSLANLDVAAGPQAISHHARAPDQGVQSLVGSSTNFGDAGRAVRLVARRTLPRGERRRERRRIDRHVTRTALADVPSPR